MRAVVQRVSHGEVKTAGETVGKIGEGLLVFLGVAANDSSLDLKYLAEKIYALRIFEDDDGKMNLALKDTGKELLCVSQFTLYGDCRKGNRPSFTGAAVPQKAESLYEEFCRYLRDKGVKVETGKFGAMMDVDAYNDGPVTIILDSSKLF